MSPNPPHPAAAALTLGQGLDSKGRWQPIWCQLRESPPGSWPTASDTDKNPWDPSCSFSFLIPPTPRQRCSTAAYWNIHSREPLHHHTDYVPIPVTSCLSSLKSCLAFLVSRLMRITGVSLSALALIVLRVIPLPWSLNSPWSCHHSKYPCLDVCKFESLHCTKHWPTMYPINAMRCWYCFFFTERLTGHQYLLKTGESHINIFTGGFLTCHLLKWMNLSSLHL